MNVDSNPIANVQVNAMTAGAKFRSKRECFQFLVIDCEAYLPDDPNCVTSYFLKQICNGQKKRKLPS
jgi:hypothetical protein